MKQNNRMLLMVSAALLALLLAAAAGYWLADNTTGDPSRMTEASSESAGEPEVLYWVAPMDANFRRDQPGKSPMGMDLVPVYADSQSGSGTDPAVFRINPAITQNLGVRTTEATRAPMARELDAVGYTAWDPSRVSMIHSRAEGWLEQFNVASVGDRVRKGDVLYELFAPKLVSAQEEYLSALKSTNQPLIRAAELRLQSLGLSPAQIAAIGDRGAALTRLPRRADRDGVVAEIHAREGSFVNPQTTILSLADLSTIWVDVEVFQDQASWLREGLDATAEFPSFPGQQWQGRVAYIYPSLDRATRSLRLRLEFDNPERQLRPNMFANVSIAAEPRDAVLQIPREAVIRSGAGERVVVALGDGRFRVQPVSLGLISGDQAEVLSGLNAGDEVVTSGQFLLDAEANGEQALERLDSASEDVSMEGMQMKGPNADEQMQDMPANRESEIIADAVIREWLDEGRVMLRHEPIPALDWPAMTMSFDLEEGIERGGLQAGQQVRITLRPMGDGYLITAMEASGPGS